MTGEPTRERLSPRRRGGALAASTTRAPAGAKPRTPTSPRESLRGLDGEIEPRRLAAAKAAAAACGPRQADALASAKRALEDAVAEDKALAEQEAKDRAAEEAKIAAAKLALEEMMSIRRSAGPTRPPHAGSAQAELERFSCSSTCSFAETEDRRSIGAFDRRDRAVSKLAEDEARRQERVGAAPRRRASDAEARVFRQGRARAKGRRRTPSFASRGCRDRGCRARPRRRSRRRRPARVPRGCMSEARRGEPAAPTRSRRGIRGLGCRARMASAEEQAELEERFELLLAALAIQDDDDRQLRCGVSLREGAPELAVDLAELACRAVDEQERLQQGAAPRRLTSRTRRRRPSSSAVANSRQVGLLHAAEDFFSAAHDAIIVRAAAAAAAAPSARPRRRCCVRRSRIRVY